MPGNPTRGVPGARQQQQQTRAPPGSRLHPRLRPADHPARAVHEVKIVRSPRSPPTLGSSPHQKVHTHGTSVHTRKPTPKPGGRTPGEAAALRHAPPSPIFPDLSYGPGPSAATGNDGVTAVCGTPRRPARRGHCTWWGAGFHGRMRESRASFRRQRHLPLFIFGQGCLHGFRVDIYVERAAVTTPPATPVIGEQSQAPAARCRHGP